MHLSSKHFQTASSYFPGFLLLVTGLVLFYGRLFFPSPQLFYTPDLGISDSLHLNYPLKDFLHQTLSNFSLPFWNKDIGTGFPVFAESEVGALYLPNLIFFAIFPTWLAWNLSYLLLSFIAFSGTYFFCRRLLASHFASSIAAFSFTFGAFFILHTPHFNMVQAAALLPWILLVTHNCLNKSDKKYILWLSLLISQQIFTGHLQITFISLVGIVLFSLIFLLFHPSKNWFNPTTCIFLAIVSGLLVASPQLLPMYQLKNLSAISSGNPRIFENAFSLKHLLTFVLPNLFGSPASGTYPTIQPDFGIYWENVFYLGILPIIVLILALIKIITKRQSDKNYLLIFIFLPLLFAFGQNSPVSFLFNFPGFNWFRVPQRFLLLSVFFLSIFSAIEIDFWRNFLSRKLKGISLFTPLSLALIVFVVFDLAMSLSRYHLTVPVSTLLKPPSLTNMIPDSSRIYTFKPFQNAAWNQVFLHQGWPSALPYLYLRNGLDANLNLLFGKTSLDAYAGIWPQRLESFNTLINSSLLNAAAGEYVISPHPTPPSDTLTPIYNLPPPAADLPNYFLFHNSQVLNRFRFAWDYTILPFNEAFSFFANSQSFDFSHSVLLEKNPGQVFQPLTQANVDIIRDDHHQTILHTQTDKSSILIMADSYYPGWKAYINHQPTQILPANLNQRALIIPAGANIIEFKYFPDLFVWGLFISGFTLLALCLIMVSQSRFQFQLSHKILLRISTLILTRKSFSTLLPYLVLIAVSCLFFLNLFVPELKTYFTLDAGRSDILHQNLPFRLIYSEGLKHFSLPFWTNQLGTGFPLLAEGQIGAFFIPNLILYSLFPFTIAWNLSYLFSIITLSLGMYAFLRFQHLPSLASLFGSLVLSYSGFIVTHFMHINMLQTVSVLPWIMLYSAKIIAKPEKHYIAILGFFISQSISAGYFQYTFLTFLLVFVWSLFSIIRSPSKIFSNFLLLFVSVVLALGLSAIQLLPSLEYFSQTGRDQGLHSTDLFSYPFRPTQLITLVFPNYLGSPSTGTYPLPQEGYGFYWENTAYIGIIPFLLALLTLIHKKNRSNKPVILITLGSLLLAFGSATPLALIFSLPVFNLFRIPSRFLLLTSFSLAYLSAVGLVYFSQWLKTSPLKHHRLTLLTLIILIGLIDLLHFSITYNPKIPFKSLLHPPLITTHLPPQSRIYTHPSHTLAWSQVFSHTGWQDLTPFLFFKNGLDPNQSVLWHQQNIDIYSGLLPSRYYTYQSLVSEPLINLASAAYIVSAQRLDTSPNLQLVGEIPPDSALPPYFLYRNFKTLDRIRLMTDYISAKSPQEAAQIIHDQDIDLTTQVVLESVPTTKFEPLQSQEINLITDTSQEIILSIKTDKPAILYLADTYYPAWQATINQVPSPIIPANLNHRALIIPAGTNTVRFYYQNNYLIWGAITTFITGITGLLLLKLKPLPKQLLKHNSN